MILMPAYGKRWNTKEETLAAWEAGKDFKIPGGSYVSIRDIDTLKRRYDEIELAYFTKDGKMATFYLWQHTIARAVPITYI